MYRPLVAPTRPMRRKPDAEIALVTGPLDAIRSRHVLVVADIENLRYSALDLNRRFSARAFRDRLEAVARYARFHAFYTRPAGDDTLDHYFRRRGWFIHPQDIEIVKTVHGERKLANSDPAILFHTAELASRSQADTIILATGDGDLGVHLARFIKGLPKRRQVVTASLAGSTSYRLNAENNNAVDGNIEIGEDCLHRVPESREYRVDSSESQGQRNGRLRPVYLHTEKRSFPCATTDSNPDAH